MKLGSKLLSSFGKTDDIDDDMMLKAEEFLVRTISNDSSIITFDQLRITEYYKNSNSLNLTKLPPTSSSMKFHISRAFFQTYLWYNSPYKSQIDLNPIMYGYRLDEYDTLEPIVCPDKHFPDSFPLPCTCNKCARDHVCKCRKLIMACCRFCKCKQCKNPYK